MQISLNNRFADLVSGSSHSDVEIVSEQQRQTFTGLAETSSNSNPLHSKIAVCFSDNIAFTRALCLVDGYVEVLLILSPSMDEQTIDALLTSGQADELFTDRDDLKHLANTFSLSRLRPPDSEIFNTRWLLATSGTTSEPKLVSHSLASLTRTVAVNAHGKSFVWGQLYDSARFAGLQVLLQAISGGSKFVAPKADVPLCKKLKLFAEEGVNALSATPTLWRKILMTEGSEALRLRSISLGGEIADQAILDALSARFPKAKIRHIYASTEAGTGFSVSDGMEGFPVSFLKESPSQIGIKIVDNVLYIQNTLVQAKYIGGDKSFVTEDGYVNTGDRVEIIDDRVIFKGRLSGVINVGGDKVYPESVEGLLNTVDGVKLCRIFGKKSPLVGQLVVCEVVVKEGGKPIQVEKNLRAYAIENLATFERPVLYKFVKEVAVSKSGKVKR